MGSLLAWGFRTILQNAPDILPQPGQQVVHVLELFRAEILKDPGEIAVHRSAVFFVQGNGGWGGVNAGDALIHGIRTAIHITGPLHLLQHNGNGRSLDMQAVSQLTLTHTRGADDDPKGAGLCRREAAFLQNGRKAMWWIRPVYSIRRISRKAVGSSSGGSGSSMGGSCPGGGGGQKSGRVSHSSSLDFINTENSFLLNTANQ